MNLSQSLELIKRHEKELALFNLAPGDSIADELRTYFETQNVRITAERTASGRPANVAVLSSRSGVLAVVPVLTLRELIDRVPGGSGTGIADWAYEEILAHLKETTFTSYDSEQMLYASREIEDRARRVGGGTIHAGFQRFSVMAAQEPVYTDLDARGVEIHAYGDPDTVAPDFGSAQIHAVDTDEIEQTWFVAFDGDGETDQKCALLAEEQADRSFYGAWTYDGPIVDSICGYLEGTYVSPDGPTPDFER